MCAVRGGATNAVAGHCWGHTVSHVEGWSLRERECVTLGRWGFWAGAIDVLGVGCLGKVDAEKKGSSPRCARLNNHHVNIVSLENRPLKSGNVMKYFDLR